MIGRILLVEDEELVGTMVQMNLEAAGYEVVWIKSGLEAEKIAATELFDIVLLDIALPGRDGLELLTNLRHAGLGIPIMMLTARGDVPTKVQALQIGADDYLPKPFDVEELLARVHALVRRSNAER